MQKILLMFLICILPCTCYAQTYVEESEEPTIKVDFESQEEVAAELREEPQENLAKEEEAYSIWDFGKVQEGEVLEHSFILQNDSQDTLNINSLNTSCGCTVSEVEKKSLAPGESTTINVIFNSKGYSGAVQQQVFVNTDNLENPVIKLTIKAEILRKEAIP
ncbi:MAG: hypothetical protein DRP74_02565 [Candidatus Omnitrophota bacterium]|nr:MAG: hypothetical protein DRP74_02565 [Candidatus Omnitrophota bacterium]